jgi:hypothetical protein
MPLLLRWVVRLCCAAAIAATSIFGTLVWVGLHQLDKPPVALTAGLTGTWDRVTLDFDNRVKAAFPIGTSVKAMGAELQREGFSRADWESLSEQEHEAVRREDNFVCKQAARIHWRASGEGRLTAIRGLYHEEGCL